MIRKQHTLQEQVKVRQAPLIRQSLLQQRELQQVLLIHRLLMPQQHREIQPVLLIRQ